MLRIPFGVLIAIAALASAGCGVAGTGFGPAPVSGQRCVGVPDAVCLRLRNEAQAAAPIGAGALVGIEIVCTTTCTEARGDATVTQTYANGQTIRGQQGWATPIGPLPGEPGGPVFPGPTELPIEPECIGVDEAHCVEFAAEMLAAPPLGAVPVSVEVRCTGTCTEASGDVTATARFSDGSSISMSWAYRSG